MPRDNTRSLFEGVMPGRTRRLTVKGRKHAPCPVKCEAAGARSLSTMRLAHLTGRDGRHGFAGLEEGENRAFAYSL